MTASFGAAQNLAVERIIFFQLYSSIFNALQGIVHITPWLAYCYIIALSDNENKPVSEDNSLQYRLLSFRHSIVFYRHSNS